MKIQHYIKYFIVLLFVQSRIHLYAQNDLSIDSLQNLIKSASKSKSNDIFLIDNLNELSAQFRLKDDIPQAIKTVNNALFIANSKLLKNENSNRNRDSLIKEIAKSYNVLGHIHSDQNNYFEALKDYSLSLKKYEEINDKTGMSLEHNLIGNIQESLENYPVALNEYYISLKYGEENNNKTSIASAKNDIGLINWQQEHFSEALKNMLEALKLMQEIGNKENIATTEGNLGLIYCELGKYDEALKNLFASLKTKEESGNKQNIANAYNDLAIVYDQQGKYLEALMYFSKSLKMEEDIGDKNGIAASYINLGDLNVKMKKFSESKKYYDKGIAISKEIGYKKWLTNGYTSLSRLDSAMGNYKAALEHYKLSILYKDSLINKENTEKSVRAEMKYQYDKKQDAEQIIQEKKDAVLKKEKQKQKLILLFVICGLLVVIVFTVFLFNRYRIIQNQKKIIELQKQKVDLAYIDLDEKNKIIEEKNKSITDSINYSKRIQDASLPTKELKQKLFPNSFILFKPKDIVSGDFYWYTEKNGKKLIACCDCTGHGVPGALMSMIGNNILNQIVNENGITSPNEILNHLHKEVRKTLKQEEQSVNKDGMDISIIAFNSETEIEYAGAQRPLWIVSNSELKEENNKLENITNKPLTTNSQITLTEIKADKYSIGGSQSETERKFTNHKLSLSKGDSVYIFSDGFADQFGGIDEKRFMSKRFKDLLLSIFPKPMIEQENELIKTILSWKGSNDQVDDILVIGIRI